jgi:hypothetical protein
MPEVEGDTEAFTSDYFDSMFEEGFFDADPVDPDDDALSLMGQGAVKYARMGLLVFPKRPGGKAPILKGGQKIGTNDERQVARWWTDHPNANIGITTGIPTVHGALVRDPVFIDVVDFDAKIMHDGTRLKNGDLGLDCWTGANLQVGAIGVARTRHGGTHIYYPSKGARSSATKLYAIDFLATGASVTAPPSKIRADSGIKGPGVYEWVTPLDVSLKGIPASWGWFFKEIEGTVCDAPKPPRPVVARTPGSERALLRKLAQSMRESGEGGRNRDLYSKACYLFREYPDCPPDELIIAAMQAGLGEEEAFLAVASAAASTGSSWEPDGGLRV